MSDASETPQVPAAQAFDAALIRGRTAMAEPLPVLPKVDPAKTPARMVAESRGVLFARLAHAAPAAEAAELHGETVRALSRLRRRLVRRRVRVAVAGFLMTYWVAILSFLVTAVLMGLALLYREAIFTFIEGLLAQPPAAPGTGQSPANAAPPASSFGAPAPAGTKP